MWRGTAKGNTSRSGNKGLEDEARDSVHRVDHEGVKNRRRGRLRRRTYNVQGPNHLWQIDTNHKLVRWHLVVIGGIDGFSGLPVMLSCMDNN